MRAALVLGLALSGMLAAAAAPAAAVQVPAQSAAGFPNGRTSNDPPANAIDGNTSTYTWTTEALNTASPSYGTGPLESRSWSTVTNLGNGTCTRATSEPSPSRRAR